MRLLFSGPSVIQSVFLRERGRPRKPNVRGWSDGTTGGGTWVQEHWQPLEVGKGNGVSPEPL